MIKLSDHLYIPGMGRVLEEAERAKAAKPQRARREFAGAKVNRLNNNWDVVPTTANYELRISLARLRARARQMARDDAHAKKFLGMVRSNVIGPSGIQLQSRARGLDQKLNTDLNKRVEEAFWEWTHRETCTVSQKLDWIASQRLFVTTLARDGEVLVQKVAADNGWGFSLKFIDVSYLDETYNDIRPDGNRVIMSVEIDDNGKPVGFWLTTPSSDINFVKRRERIRTRVPAEQMIHAFLVYDDESQVRGVTWYAPVLLDAKNLKGYNEGVITSARMTAMSMGFIIKNEDGLSDLTGVEDEDGNPADIEIDIAPATFNELPAGYDLKQFDPKQPTQNHGEFKRTLLADIASGLGLNYFSLAGDMNAVNYSSARVGLGEERDLWREIQTFVATHFCRDVFHEWARAARINGKLKVNSREYREIQNPQWNARGWAYIDPTKETDATVTALDRNLTTYTAVLGERGIDLIDHLETIKSERELFEQYDVEYGPPAVAAPGAQPPAESGDTEEKPPPEKAKAASKT